MEGCWLALGGPACQEEATALADARVYLEMLEGLEEGGELADLQRLEEQLGRLFAQPDTEAGDELQLMTIHKSKGLEFDTVILPGLGRIPRRETERLLLWIRITSYNVCYTKLLRKGTTTTGNSSPLDLWMVMIRTASMFSGRGTFSSPDCFSQNSRKAEREP